MYVCMFQKGSALDSSASVPCCCVWVNFTPAHTMSKEQLTTQQEDLRWANLDRVLLRSSPFAHETLREMVKGGNASEVRVFMRDIFACGGDVAWQARTKEDPSICDLGIL
mmetsp:Transcript_2605/g.9936  ORF Transcript_2605/g.9936 Transcript_2605/m.9936 type:complete len:110 (+) Transcript_2605:2314-2643(+)